MTISFQLTSKVFCKAIWKHEAMVSQDLNIATIIIDFRYMGCITPVGVVDSPIKNKTNKSMCKNKMNNMYAVQQYYVATSVTYIQFVFC